MRLKAKPRQIAFELRRRSPRQSTDVPDYDNDLSFIKTLLSDGYLERYYKQEATESASLRGVDQEVINQMIEGEISRISELRYTGVALLALFVVYYAVFTFAQTLKSPYDTVLQLAASSALLAIEFITFNINRRSHYCTLATLSLFGTVRELEQNESFWSGAGFRTHIASHLETTAKSIERIPLMLTGIAPGVRREAFALSAGKARSMRELQLTLVTSGEFGFEDIIKRLCDDMQVLAVGRWYDLPGKKYQRRVPRWLTLLQVCGAVIAIGAMVATIGLAPKVGPVASVLAPLLGTVAVIFLNRAGLPLSVIERYTEAGMKLSSGK